MTDQPPEVPQGPLPVPAPVPVPLASPGAAALAAAVQPDAVRALMTTRPATLVQRDPGGLLAQELAGMATEVVAIAGDPVPPALFNLAVRCLTLGVAYSIEQAAYPEQQLDGGRAEQLRTRFLAVRADLTKLRADVTPGASGTGTYWSGFVSLGRS